MSHLSSRHGLPAYQGYEYQLLVSGWLALVLILEQRTSATVEVEPASGEDVEARLEVDPDKVSSTLRSGAESTILQFQVKLRRTGPWTAPSFLDVLQGKDKDTTSRGPARRMRPLDALKANPELQFYFITNAEVGPELKAFVVNQVGQNNAAQGLPERRGTRSKKRNAAEEAALARRIFILEKCTHDRVENWIEHILSRYAHLPLTKADECLADLKSCVRARLLGSKPPQFSDQELREVIRRNGGMPQPSPALAAYVAPTIFDQLVHALKVDHVVLLTGAPGVGKTLTAEMLVWFHQTAEEPFEVIRPTSPGDIRSHLVALGRYLFYIEDPWGLYKQADGADRWTSELPKLMEQAGPDKLFVITTRTGLFSDAVGGSTPRSFARYLHTIKAEHYDDRARAKILQGHLENARPWQQDFARVHRRTVIRHLTVPYSLAVFARLLKHIQDGQEMDTESLIKQSTVESISETVAAEIQENPESVACTTVLWAVLMATKSVDEEQARTVRRAVRAVTSTYRLELVEFLQWLSQGEWLGVNASGQYEAHPQVLAGLELLIARRPTVAGEVFEALLTGLVQTGRVETAHRVITRLTDRRLPIPESVQQAINNYLIGRLVSGPEQDFHNAFHDASRWATSYDDPVSALTKGLTPPADEDEDRPWSRLGVWQRPDWPATKRADVGASEEARKVAGKFVRLVLPHSNVFYSAEEFLSFLRNLGWDLSPEFQEVAQTVVARSCLTHDVLVRGALSGESPPFAELLTTTLERLDEAEAWESQHQRELHQADQAEIDAAYATHLNDELGEHFQPVYDALRIILAIHRQRVGSPLPLVMPYLHRYPRLVKAWSEAIIEELPAESPELRELIGVCPPNDRRPALRAIVASGCRELAPVVLTALTEAPLELLAEVITALLSLIEPRSVIEEILEVSREEPFERRARIVAASWSLDHEIDGQALSDALTASLLTSREQTPLRVCRMAMERPEATFPAVHLPTIELLRVLACSAPDSASAIAVRVLARYGMDVREFVPNLLKSDDYAVRFHGLGAAFDSQSPELQVYLMAGLHDAHYRCRRIALWAVSQSATPDERNALLAMQDDPSAPVRQALAEVIGELQWPEGLTTLCELLLDTRNKSEGNDTHFHVARAAACSLAAFATLPPDTVDCIISFLERGAEASEDLHVHYTLILEVVSKAESPRTLPLLRKCLTSRREVAGMKVTRTPIRWSKLRGYPIRYAGAWALFEHLLRNPVLRQDAPISEIVEAASDIDARRAGPAILCLGVVGPAAGPDLHHVLKGPECSHTRCILAAAGYLLANHPIPYPELLSLLPANHAGLKVLQWITEHPIAGDRDWVGWVKQDQDVANWLRALEDSDDVNVYLRFALRRLSANRINTYLPIQDLHQDDLPEPIKRISSRSLAGGE